ncbi:MAG: hypothetical protein ACR2NM_06965 [Bythopirellula sp.]
MHPPIRFFVHEQTESSASVVLEFPRDGDVAALTGRLVGPHCQVARTLPADFSFKKTTLPANLPEALSYLNGVTWYKTQVIDPCYWTPELPFLYDLQLAVEFEDGSSVDRQLRVGLTRWGPQWRDLRLENRRIVLRGASIEQPTVDVIPAARDASSALLITQYDDSFCAAADQAGVIVGLDLRNVADSIDSILTRLDFSPSVFLVIVDPDRHRSADFQGRLASHCIVADCLSPRATAEDYANSSTVVAFELDADERPPSWLSMSSRPVIAIRRGKDYADLVEARAACDRLQAELAPEFDLAGYFVAL